MNEMNAKIYTKYLQLSLSLLTITSMVLLAAGLPLPVRAACDNPGTPGDDNIICDGANDTVDAGAGNDTVDGGYGDDIIDAGAGDDTVSGWHGHDTIDAGDGNDHVEGMWGDDTIFGGSGDDTLNAGYNNDTVYGGDGDDTINGQGLVDHLYGEDGDDTLIGGGDDCHDYLYGGPGNDSLDSGDGIDMLYGDEGDDHLDGGPSGDVIRGGDGIDTVDYSQSAAEVNVDLSITGHQFGGDAHRDTFPDTDVENVIGSSGNDTLTGNDDNNWIEGGPGADVIDGEAGWDTASYSQSAAPVDVDLAAGTGVGGEAQGDTLSEIEGISGSPGADTLTGDAGDNWFEGLAGADVIDGGPGWDNADYSQSPAGVTLDLGSTAPQVSAGDASGDTLINLEGVHGSSHDDTIIGSAGDDWIEGGPGADTITGGDGWDITSYMLSEEAVTVDLSSAAPQVSTGEANGDILTGIEGVIGSPGDDMLTGSDQGNHLEGGPGADEIRGGDGDDFVDYWWSEDPVTVDLGSIDPQVSAGDASGDTFPELDIEGVRGSQGADTLTGNEDDNWFETGMGADTVDGGAGFDRAQYNWSEDPVTVNLETNVNTGGEAEGDTLTNIEMVMGSQGNDSLTGDAGDNVLFGSAGDDIINGGAGNDVLGGDAGTDIINGGLGDDELILQGLLENDDYNGGGGDDVYIFDSTSRWAQGPVTGAATLRASSGTLDFSLFGFAVSIDLGLQDVPQNVGNNLFLTLVGDFLNVVGTPFGDTITGNSQANDLQGGDGDDTLDGGLGLDFLNGGNGNDSVVNYQATDAHVNIENGQPEAQAPVPEGVAPLVLFENSDLVVTLDAQGDLVFIWQGVPLTSLTAEQWSSAGSGTVLLNEPYAAEGILLHITALGSGQFLMQCYSLVDGALMDSTIITP
jgi:Ca2+-binding RTX toxin-like protein